jgi:hypothetical protein
MCHRCDSLKKLAAAAPPTTQDATGIGVRGRAPGWGCERLALKGNDDDRQGAKACPPSTPDPDRVRPRDSNL